MKKSVVLAVMGLGIWLSQPSLSQSSPWPLQLEMRVPIDPSAFSSDGRTRLTYELYLTNFTSKPLTLSRIEVLDAGGTNAQPIAAFEGEQLAAVLEPIGIDAQSNQGGNARQLAPGGTAVAFMWVTVEPGAHVPYKLRHRVITADSAAEGAAIETHHNPLKLLAGPVQGSDWLASDGPSNDRDNHHRRGVFLIDGHPLISRRYAIDWMQVQDGKSFSGDASDKRSYYSYGKPVLAVDNATVVAAKDGLPDNVPGHNTPGHEGFKPAVAINMDTLGGNTIVLDLGNGQFAHYFHLQPGSVRVKAGEHVTRGQLLALIGASGDAREPHLHFEITSSPKLMAGEGLPYLIDHFRVKSQNGWDSRARELPLQDMVIDFGR
jgi:hypothetical protein